MVLRHPHKDYSVGWVCALSIELAAAKLMLDAEHEHRDFEDTSLYTLGRIGEHNVVIACLPAGQTGNSSAAAVALQMKSHFPSIRFGLMVGIGGGVPSKDRDIRLGDVVVSQPHAEHGGVVQYDFRKTTPSGVKRTGFLNMPPTILLQALSQLQSNHFVGNNKLQTYLSPLCEMPAFQRDLAGPDVLYEASYNHVEDATSSCESCGEEWVVKRHQRGSDNPILHYGTIASGNQVMRDGATRDKVSSELGGVLCFEMEAAGLMNNFPCLVIRGICDYADSHKNKSWQGFAAGAAAACAKELLSVIPASKVSETPTVAERIATAAVQPTVEGTAMPSEEESMAEATATLTADESTPQSSPGPSRYGSDHTGHWTLLDPGSKLGRRVSRGTTYIEAKAILNVGVLMSILLVVLMLGSQLGWLGSGNSESKIDWSPAETRIDHSLPIFALLGRTGVGKSTFIKSLGGRESNGNRPQVCHGLDSCTQNLTFYKASVDNKQVYLVDTPGFNDVRMSDTEILQLIFQELVKLYHGDKLIKGLIYLHDISQTRFGWLALKHFHAFETLCGKGAFSNVVLVTTKWLRSPSHEESQRELQREFELKSKYWKNMVDHGSYVERHDGSAESARRIITILLYKPKITLLTPPETIDEDSIIGLVVPDHGFKKTGKNDSWFGSKLTHWMGYGWEIVIWPLFRVLLVALVDFVAFAFVMDSLIHKLPASTVFKLVGWMSLLMGPYWSIGLFLRLPFVEFLRLY